MIDPDTRDGTEGEKRQPWHRHELDRDGPMWDAFRVYRDTPPRLRTFRLVAQKVGQTIKRVEQWARAAMWKERVAAFDRYIDRDACRIVVADRRDHIVRHLQLSQGLGEIAAVEARKLLARARELVEENQLTPREIARLAETAVKLERLTRGEATEITTDGDIDLSKLGTDELEALRTLQAKAKR